MKLKAAIYCRLSKEDLDKECEEQESQSIINQTMMLLDYVEKNGFELYDIYKDDDYSGLYDDRPGFEKLIHDAEARKFDVVISKSQSRFTRNIEHLEKYLHHDFPLWGIRFISLVDNVDTAVKGNKKSRQINALINEWYCEDLSESIRASFKIKQQKGQFLGQSAPYGYVKSPEDHHLLIPDPYAAGIVKRIFHMYLSGIGKDKIGCILTEEGVLIPSEYKRRVLHLNYHNANEKYGESSRWSFQTINTILKNEVYIGHLVQNKCVKRSYKTKGKKAVPKEEWIRVENIHEPIIDEQTFRRVQERLAERHRETNIHLLNEGLFARRLFCGDCGKPMAPYYTKRKKNGERHKCYICSEYKRFGNRYCTSHKIREDTLKEIILKDLQQQAKVILNSESKGRIREFKCISGSENRAYKLNELNEELKKIGNYKAKAFENFADGLLNKSEYVKLKENYDEREKELQRKIQKCKGEQVEPEGKADFGFWLENFADNFDVKELTREMVLNLIDSIYIFEDHTVEVNYKFRIA